MIPGLNLNDSTVQTVQLLWVPSAEIEPMEGSSNEVLDITCHTAYVSQTYHQMELPDWHA